MTTARRRWRAVLVTGVLAGAAGAAAAAGLCFLSPRPLAPHELQALQRAHPSCTVPGAGRLLDWVQAQRAAGRTLPAGLYWARPHDPAETGYALYVLLPSQQVVDYGQLVFDAHAVLQCEDPAARPCLLQDPD